MLSGIFETFFKFYHLLKDILINVVYKEALQWQLYMWTKPCDVPGQHQRKNNNCKLESVYVLSYRKHWEQQNGRALHNHGKCE